MKEVPTACWLGVAALFAKGECVEDNIFGFVIVPLISVQQEMKKKKEKNMKWVEDERKKKKRNQGGMNDCNAQKSCNVL